MAKTIIKTPFPSTVEVARKLGVSSDRVRKVERMVFHDSAAGQFIVKSDKAATFERKKIVRSRDKA